MELVALYKRVIGLDVHQAQITACALIEECDGTTRIEQRQFGAFKKDRRALAEWAAQLCPDEVVMERHRHLLEKPLRGAGDSRDSREGCKCPARQECSGAQD